MQPTREQWCGADTLRSNAVCCCAVSSCLAGFYFGKGVKVIGAFGHSIRAERCAAGWSHTNSNCSATVLHE